MKSSSEKGPFGNEPLVGDVTVEDPFGDRLRTALMEVLEEVLDYGALGAPPPHSRLHRRHRSPANGPVLRENLVIQQRETVGVTDGLFGLFPNQGVRDTRKNAVHVIGYPTSDLLLNVLAGLGFYRDLLLIRQHLSACLAGRTLWATSRHLLDRMAVTVRPGRRGVSSASRTSGGACWRTLELTMCDRAFPQSSQGPH